MSNIVGIKSTSNLPNLDDRDETCVRVYERIQNTIIVSFVSGPYELSFNNKSSLICHFLTPCNH